MAEKFELQDSAGQTHSYRVELHPSREGQRIIFGLGPAMVRAISTLLSQHREYISEHIKAAREGTEVEGQTMADVIDELLSSDKVDVEAIGDSLAVVLSNPSNEHIATALFAHTFRDGKPLARPEVYDAAWQGNYGEWFAAMREVIDRNGFLVFIGGRRPTDTSEMTPVAHERPTA